MTSAMTSRSSASTSTTTNRPLRPTRSSVPTMILFKDGEMVKKMVGAMPKRKLLAELEPALA